MIGNYAYKKLQNIYEYDIFFKFDYNFYIQSVDFFSVIIYMLDSAPNKQNQRIF